MNNQITKSNVQKTFDLIERTSKFGEEIIVFVQLVQINHITKPIVSQLVRAGTSIGANYCEATEANSKKDFRHKIGIARKEAKETMYWLQMISKADSDNKSKARELWQEAHEFVLIFSAIHKKS